jgi:hypothetical protein
MREHLASSQQLIAADYERGRDAGRTWAATADGANCKRISLLVQCGSASGEPYISQSIPEVFQVLAPPYPDEIRNVSFCSGFTFGILDEWQRQQKSAN